MDTGPLLLTLEGLPLLAHGWVFGSHWDRVGHLSAGV